MRQTIRPSVPARTRTQLTQFVVRMTGMLSLLVLAVAPPAHASSRCVVGDNGSGTAQFPPYCAGYHGRRDEVLVENGLPVGSHLLGSMQLTNLLVISELPGGALGGHQQAFGGTIRLSLTGTGAMAGYTRVVDIPIANGATHTGPRGGPLQNFPTDMFMLNGQVGGGGDPDFDLLRITAGTNFGMPSPGHTTLTRLPSGDWAVDSFFDITYRIDFVGHPGGTFGGMSGSTVSLMRVREGSPLRTRCAVPDNGGATADLPANCADGTRSLPDATLIKDGLPVGTSVQGTLRLRDVTVTLVTPGGTLGGDIVDFKALADVDGWHDRSLGGSGGTPVFRTIPVVGQCETGPGSPGDPTQGVPMDLTQLFGQIIGGGDPDFDLLRIVAGTSFGMPSPGHTTLTVDAGGNWAVDSFFDITYRVDFVGHAGSLFGGMSGSTTSKETIRAGVPPSTSCTVPDVAGTAEFPCLCMGGYTSEPEVTCLLNGLPPGSPVEGQITMLVNSTAEFPGGSLGGNAQSFNGRVIADLQGHGVHAGYARTFVMAMTGASATGPRTPGTTPQNFPTDLLSMQGQITGDPDFDLLRIVAGTGFGMPSPGHTTLTKTPLLEWVVDSFFDITYRIDFIGAPGGPFAGTSGSTVGRATIRAGDPKSVLSVAHRAALSNVSLARPNPARDGAAIQLELPRAERADVVVHDIAGRQVRVVVSSELGAGSHSLAWDGRNAAGLRVAPGLYFFKVRLGDQSVVRRVVVSH